MMMECKDEADYKRLRSKVNEFDRARRRRYPGQNGLTKDEIAAIGVPSPTNDERSAIETWEFKHSQPEKYVAYANFEKRIVTTWTGQVLGQITEIGRKYTNNFGDQKTPIKITGINGVLYHARSSGTSMAFHMKARKKAGVLVTA